MNIILLEENLFNGTSVFLPKEDVREYHVRRILKLLPGDIFKGGMLNGPVGELRIEAYEEEGLRLSWRETGPPVGPYPLILLVGYMRPISAKRVLREAASLGAEGIIFTRTDTGEKSYSEAKLWKDPSRWGRFLIDGLQQAGATILPYVGQCWDLSTALETVEASSRLLLDNEIGVERLAALDLSTAGKVILAVGSERGWSKRERESFIEAGYQGVHLGKRILRTETACSAGIALALSRMGLL